MKLKRFFAAATLIVVFASPATEVALPPGAAQPSATATGSLARPLRAELREAQGIKAQLVDPTDASTPEGVSFEDRATAIRRVDNWVVALQGQMHALDGRQRTQAELALVQIEQTQDATVGAANRSVRYAEQLAAQAAMHQRQITAQSALISVTERELDSLSQELKALEESRRSAQAAASSEASTGDRTPQAWRAQAAEWAVRSMAAAMAALHTRRLWAQDRLALEQLRLSLTRREQVRLGDEVVFSRAELDEIRASEQRKRAAQQQQAQRFKLEALRWADELARARRLPEPPLVNQSRVNALRTAEETATRSAEVHDAMAALSGFSESLWMLRFDVMNGQTRTQRLHAIATIDDIRKGLQLWRSYAQGQLAMVSADVIEQARTAGDLPATDPRREHASAALASLQTRQQRLQDLASAIDDQQQTVLRWQDEVNQGARALNWSQKWEVWKAQAMIWALEVWNLELFAIQDTMEVQGQRVPIARGVTLGKSLGVGMIFILGYWVSARLSVALERLLASRFALDIGVARTTRRWVMALLMVLILLLTLNLSHIPLSVFAFLGGALAIGVGFGTQTLIKNFVSGLILLMQRHVRVGDSIELDRFAGKVSEINLRSTTIRTADGHDAIVPNSFLLEGSVTNLTAQDTRVRRAIKLGLPYGCSVSAVRKLLLDCAQNHPAVLEEPAPQVLLEDFGDNALVFGLYLWLDLKTCSSVATVLSDLRIQIEDSLRQAKIDLPFPQREVYLRAPQPLQFEIKST